MWCCKRGVLMSNGLVKNFGGAVVNVNTFDGVYW